MQVAIATADGERPALEALAAFREELETASPVPMAIQADYVEKFAKSCFRPIPSFS